jgi:hypothetical protein
MMWSEEFLRQVYYLLSDYAENSLHVKKGDLLSEIAMLC